MGLARARGAARPSGNGRRRREVAHQRLLDRRGHPKGTRLIDAGDARREVHGVVRLAVDDVEDLDLLHAHVVVDLLDVELLLLPGVEPGLEVELDLEAPEVHEPGAARVVLVIDLMRAHAPARRSRDGDALVEGEVEPVVAFRGAVLDVDAGHAVPQVTTEVVLRSERTAFVVPVVLAPELLSAPVQRARVEVLARDVLVRAPGGVLAVVGSARVAVVALPLLGAGAVLAHADVAAVVLAGVDPVVVALAEVAHAGVGHDRVLDAGGTLHRVAVLGGLARHAERACLVSALAGVLVALVVRALVAVLALLPVGDAPAAEGTLRIAGVDRTRVVVVAALGSERAEVVLAARADRALVLPAVDVVLAVPFGEHAGRVRVFGDLAVLVGFGRAHLGLAALGLAAARPRVVVVAEVVRARIAIVAVVVVTATLDAAAGVVHAERRVGVGAEAVVRVVGDVAEQARVDGAVDAVVDDLRDVGALVRGQVAHRDDAPVAGLTLGVVLAAAGDLVVAPAGRRGAGVHGAGVAVRHVDVLHLALSGEDVADRLRACVAAGARRDELALTADALVERARHVVVAHDGRLDALAEDALHLDARVRVQALAGELALDGVVVAAGVRVAPVLGLRITVVAGLRDPAAAARRVAHVLGAQVTVVAGLGVEDVHARVGAALLVTHVERARVVVVADTRLVLTPAVFVVGLRLRLHVARVDGARVLVVAEVLRLQLREEDAAVAVRRRDAHPARARDLGDALVVGEALVVRTRHFGQHVLHRLRFVHLLQEVARRVGVRGRRDDVGRLGAAGVRVVTAGGEQEVEEEGQSNRGVVLHCSVRDEASLV